MRLKEVCLADGEKGEHSAGGCSASSCLPESHSSPRDVTDLSFSPTVVLQRSMHLHQSAFKNQLSNYSDLFDLATARSVHEVIIMF